MDLKRDIVKYIRDKAKNKYEKAINYSCPQRLRSDLRNGRN